jgi:ABC-type transport system substrate-binding protein
MHRSGKLALIAAVLLTAAACGGGTSSGDSAKANEAHATQSSDCPGLSGQLDKNATFTWMYSVDTTSFDPDKITSNNSQMYLYPIYDSLVHIDATGTPQPMLAKSWKLIDNGDTLEMTLIDDWKYQDGTPFDAASVKANIERSINLPGSFNKTALSSVTSVDAADPHTVRIHTSGGAGALIGVLAGSAGMMMSPAAFDKPGEDQHPTGGSGAFELTNYVPGSKAEYTAVDHYWDPSAVNVKKLVFTISSDDNARLNAVETGAADATFLRASMYDPAKQAGLVVCQAPSLSVYTLNLNTQRSEFGKDKVREALSYAIDRDAVKQVTDGFCTPTSQMFPTSYFASDPDMKPTPHDAAKAKQLLADAGLPQGFSFSLEVINLALYQQIAEVMQANLAEAGIKMSITPVDISRLAEDFSVNKSVDAIFFEQKPESDPSSLTAEYYLADGFNNPGGLSTSKIQQLQAETLKGSTPEERSKAFKDLFDAVKDQAGPNIPVCNLTTPFAMNDKARGVDIYADASRQFRGVGIAAKP